MLNLRPFEGTLVPDDKAKLICYSGEEARTHCLPFTGNPIQQLTSFLDIRPKPEEVWSSWPTNWQMIGVYTDHTHEQIPFYLREYWTNCIKPWIERVIEESKHFIAHSNSGNEPLSTWRVVDVSAGSLMDDEILRIAEFSYYITNTLNLVRPPSEIQIEEPGRLGSVLNWTKQYYLRHHFSRQALTNTTIKVRPIKREKVFFVELDRERQDPKYYIVKFDYPEMIDRERENYDQVWKTLETNRRELLNRVYRVEPAEATTFGGNDILALIVSEAVRSDIPPEDQTLHRQWLQVTNAKKASQFFELVSPVFDVLAYSPKKVKYVRSKADELFKKFFRKMNGFTLFRDFNKIDEFLPAIFEGNKRRKNQYRIRRVKLEVLDSSDELQLSMQLQPRGRERVLVRFQEFSKTEEWPSILSKLNLLNLSHLELDPRVLEEDQQIWSNAIAALGRLIDTSRLEDDRELTILGKYLLLNPIKFFKEVHSGQIISFQMGEFETIQARIHFDLHLENILIPGLGVGPKLIDLASMEEGPIDYDYARMEARLVLEMVTAPQFANLGVDKQIGLVLKFAEALKAREVASCPRDMRKEFTFIKRLREKREETLENLRTSAKGIIFPKDEKTLSLCLLFEYLSELFERASTTSPSMSQLLTAFVSAAYYLKNLEP